MFGGCSFNLNKNYTGLFIGREEWNYINIGFQFWEKDRELVYGVSIKPQFNERRPMEIPLELRESLRRLPNNSPKNNNWWPWYNYMDQPYRNWSKPEAYKAIFDGSMKRVILEKINMILDMTRGLNQLEMSFSNIIL